MDRTVLYAVVVYWERSDHRIVADHPVEAAPAYRHVALSAMGTVKSSEEETVRVDLEKYSVHILLGELRYACVTPIAESSISSSRLATSSQALLHRLRCVYRELPILADLSRDLANLSIIDLSAPLKKILEEHNHEEAAVLPKLEGELAEVQRALMQGVQKLIDRGQRLDELIKRTQSLQITVRRDFRGTLKASTKKKNIVIATTAAAVMVLSTVFFLAWLYVGIL